MPSLVVFDCDGTLVDSQRAIIAAVRTTFAAHGLDVPEDDAIRRIVGLSVPEALNQLLGEAESRDLEALAADFKESFSRRRLHQGAGSEPLYPGIAAAIEELARSDYLLAMATGKSMRGAGATLAHHGLGHHFLSLQTADRHPSKPHPAMLEAAMADLGAERQETVLVGDTQYDMMMARAAGVRALGVAWGYHPVDELEAAGAEAVALSADALPADIARIMEWSQS